MSVSRKMFLAAGIVLMTVGVFRMKAASSDGARRKEIEAFNKKFVELHLKLDTAGVLALWAEDGVDLMPGEAPLIGKKTIVAWVEAIVSKMPGYEVNKEEVEFHDIQVSGDWASEWATEHQVVQPPEGKPPIEGYGKMILVLHREANGEWKIKQEMWNAAPRP
ncbi:MAG: nuclear transport factor 2 family protein [Acidobacteria bacterium]|nr:nuclear transport factor 2 family protein [Acidobacteriota bacterium]MBI3664499.1 nuclear transport factor 2 family protein [Acidobacteriota bacterium]